MLKIFVYGTLKRGFKQHERHMKGARFLGEAETAEATYHLVVITEPDCDFIYPAMVTGGPYRIKGELFEIEANHLARLDEYEGEHYERSEITLSGGACAQTYVYLGSCPHSQSLTEHPRLVTQNNTQMWLAQNDLTL